MKKNAARVGPSRQVPESPCPSCGKTMNAALSVDGGDHPSPNDITLCLYCGHIMAFDERLHLRNLTDAEIKKAAGDPLILQVQRARALAKPRDADA